MTKKHLFAGVITLCLMSLLVAPVVLANVCCSGSTWATTTAGCGTTGETVCASATPYCYDDACHAEKKTIGLPSSSYVNENMNVMDTAETIIDYLMGFLGLIAVVIVLIGGFQWMTAAGNEDKVGTAKKTLSAGIIGIVIVLAAWGIARFVINLLAKA